jgi:O-antigen/teichoic acid export membrane protein
VPTVNKLSLLNALRTVKLKVRMSVGFFLAQLSFAFVILSDRYYIFNFLGSEAAGNYDLFYKVFNLFLVVSLIFIKPVWAKLAEDSSAEKVKKIKVLYNVFLCFLIFFIFIFCFFVNDIVYLWLGKGYELSMVDAFLFGSFFFFLIAIAKSCYILNALNKVDIQWKVFFIYLILKFVILFFILIDPVSLSLSLILSSNGLLFFVFVFLEFYIGRYCKLNGID